MAEGCYGEANLEKKAWVTPESVFNIAFLSKAMVASSAMLLVDEGKLSLDDPVSKFFKDAPVA